jgi:hypothetical protein
MKNFGLFCSEILSQITIIAVMTNIDKSDNVTPVYLGVLKVLN